MIIKREYHKLVSWIAILAILLGSFAPTISHAITANGSSRLWQEICTQQGTKLLPSDSPAPDQKEIPGHLEHCPYCSIHADTQVLPPSSSALFFATSVIETLAVQVYRSPVINAYFQSSHPPQAPPSLD